jgi:hypothetical protein
MSKPKKCGNPSCSCETPAGAKYCSAHCEGTAGRTELACLCGHAGCQGDIGLHSESKEATGGPLTGSRS